MSRNWRARTSVLGRDNSVRARLGYKLKSSSWERQGQETAAGRSLSAGNYMAKSILLRFLRLVSSLVRCKQEPTLPGVLNRP